MYKFNNWIWAKILSFLLTEISFSTRAYTTMQAGTPIRVYSIIYTRHLSECRQKLALMNSTHIY